MAFITRPISELTESAKAEVETAVAMEVSDPVGKECVPPQLPSEATPSPSNTGVVAVA